MRSAGGVGPGLDEHACRRGAARVGERHVLKQAMSVCAVAVIVGGAQGAVIETPVASDGDFAALGLSPLFEAQGE